MLKTRECHARRVSQRQVFRCLVRFGWNYCYFSWTALFVVA